MSHQAIGRIAGALFLAAFVCYGVGSALVESSAGTALVLLNSVVVATIGVLVFRVLRHPHPRTAATYLIARALEAVLLAVGVVLLVSMGSAAGNSLAYQFAMLILGVGSVPFCRTLLQDQFVPRWLAVWGIAGYALLAIGALLELVGLAVGLVLAIPGGLFEVALGLILMARGFPEPVATGRGSAARGRRSARYQRMRTITADTHASMRRTGLIAGLSLLLMAVLAGLATFGVLERVVTEGDASRTTADILDAFGRFRLAILALFGVAVLDVIVAWALWIFFDRVHHTVAVLAACCRGIYAVTFALAVSHLLAAARLLGDRGSHGSTDRQLQLEVLAEIQQFDDIWSLALGLFGIHLLLIGWLAFTSGFVPRFIGVLVAIAGAGYLIDSFGGLLDAPYTFELASFTFVGEVVLMVWLLLFAVRGPRMIFAVRGLRNAPTTLDDHPLTGVSDATRIRNSDQESRS